MRSGVFITVASNVLRNGGTRSSSRWLPFHAAHQPAEGEESRLRHLRVGRHGAALLELVDAEVGDEEPWAGARDDDRPHAGIAGPGLGDGVELTDHARGHELVRGIVELDDADGAVEPVLYLGHGDGSRPGRGPEDARR